MLPCTLPYVVLLALLPGAVAANGFLMRSELKISLLRIGAVSDRGQFASAIESARAAEVVSLLEGFASEAASTSALAGTWDLVYTDVEPFRASPFWWTLAAALEELTPQ